jgi:hypothetical protein
MTETSLPGSVLPAVISLEFLEVLRNQFQDSLVVVKHNREPCTLEAEVSASEAPASVGDLPRNEQLILFVVD